MQPTETVTLLLGRLGSGDRQAFATLLPLVYEELRRLAHGQLHGQRDDHTLNTTALVHETYLKLAAQATSSFEDRAHFLGICARAMRQVLVDHARQHGAQKRGGGWWRMPLEEAELPVEERAELLVALDDALTRLGERDERLCRVVEYRFFGGMTEEETATALGVTDRTVRRDWTKARLWLYAELHGDAS